jgi:hypothetical protein
MSPCGGIAGLGAPTGGPSPGISYLPVRSTRTPPSIRFHPAAVVAPRNIRPALRALDRHPRDLHSWLFLLFAL